MLTAYTNPPNRLLGTSSTKRILGFSLPVIDGSILLTCRRSYVIGLENRIVALEAKTEKLGQVAIGAPSNSPYLNKSPTGDGAASVHSEEMLAEDRLQEPQRQEDPTDALTISLFSGQDSAFFGRFPRPE